MRDAGRFTDSRSFNPPYPECPMRHSCFVFALLCVFCAQVKAQQPIDTAYTRQIRELTSAPRFNTPLTDHLPADPRLPTPLQVLGYVPGAIGRLSYVADINRYFRALDSASPRVRIFDAGRSDEGREVITVAIADSATLADLDRYRGITRRLADPRGLDEREARELIAGGKAIYHLTGSIHSPETGSPEMLMELAYRLAASETDLIRMIREQVIVLITPVLEVDGRDRMVDVYRYGRRHGVRPPLVWWGRYTAHDNNRDGMVLSQTLTRNVLAQYRYWHPTVMHDLHESVPFLYTSTGTGPYNRAIDPITVNEWHQLAFHEVNELTRLGLPGVWTHDFYDGWAPNYVMFIANLRNSIGRFYETYTAFGAECDTARLQSRQTSIEWFRPNPPINGIRWCIRNNINYQQSGVLVALGFVAENSRRFLENFWIKSRRAVERGRTGTNAWVIPASQPRRNEAAALVNLLRLHGIEVHRAGVRFSVAGVDVAPGDYVIRLDQPYGPLADNLLGVQTYRSTDPQPYDDTGWTLGALRNVSVRSIADTMVFHQPLEPVLQDVAVRGEVLSDSRAAALAINATTESNLAVLRFRLRDIPMWAAEDAFSADGLDFAAGTVIIPLARISRESLRRLRESVEELGLTAHGLREIPVVARHELDVPRIALVHSWQNTQNEGWVRYAFDRFALPYRYISTQQLADSSLLTQFDVIVMPYVSSDIRGIVHGLPMAGPPVPWRRTAETPNLGVYDETADVRPGIGLRGMSVLESWIARGGLFITEGATAGVAVNYGLAPGVSIVEPRNLRVRGSVLRATVRDRRSPIVYGYADTISVYFNTSPLFQTDTVGLRPSEQYRDSSYTADLARMLPRVVVGFHGRADSLLVSGMLESGGELAGRPAVLDVGYGRGHVVLFAIRPFWRWETQGSFALVFNAILNWNDLSLGWPAVSQPARPTRAQPAGRR